MGAQSKTQENGYHNIIIDIYLITGKSSVGKSLLFESVVLVTGHQLLSSTSSSSGDAGVGRFQTGSKNTVSCSFKTMTL